MVYAEGIFDFLNKTVKPIHNKIITEKFNALPQILKRTQQCNVDVQIAWLKLKLFD